ncbi:MAG: phosphatase PAP2 family protein [Chloroflexi bacterium]|nr:MAG: phosphatase PAP2 family protein [Chloroflexota bacterium]
MSPLMDAGVDLIVWLQRFSPALDPFFKAVTFLGTAEGYTWLIPLIYWCLHRGLGVRIGLLVSFSGWLNMGLKALFHTPRPFAYAPDRVQAITYETTPGLPSGHAQNTLVMWGYLALWVRRRWFGLLAGLLLVLIGLSRLYLGVHFPHDVLVGWLIGGVVLALAWRLGPALEGWLAARSWGVQMALALLLPLGMLAVHAGSKEALTAIGFLLGMGSGVVIERRWVRFQVGGEVGRRALRYALGIVTLLALLAGLKLLFPPGPAFRLLRYGLAGLWSAAGAPWLFLRLRLARREVQHRRGLARGR